MAPADLARFWSETIQELAQTPLDSSVEEAPEQSARDFVTQRVAMNSFQGKRIRGWYSVPKDIPPVGKLPAILAVPGYGGDKAIPTHLVMAGFAVLTLYPRAQGESLHEWKLDHGAKLTYNVTDKDKYYYRGGYMDCLRGLDFLCAQAEVDAGRLGMWSRSQGGGFTLATASLDSRLRVAVAEEPFLCNYPESIKITTSPYGELNRYVAEHPGERQAVLDTLAYFDPLNLVQDITCHTLVDIGMKDETCPFHTIMPVFEKITAPKGLHIYPDLAHSPCTDFNAHAMNWLRRYLGA
jgi:cephalosporin-C deacetylase